MSKTITHDGVVVKTDGDQVSVMIVQHSACSGCHARGACTASDQKEKIIIAADGGEHFQVGDHVILVGNSSMAWSALTYAFILPLCFALAILFGVSSLWGEGVGALSVLAVLAIYYWVLYLFRDKLKTQFSFTLRRP